MMAAGMGNRYGGPKQLEPLGRDGETMIDYALFDAQRAGFDRAVLIIRRELLPALEDTVLPRWKDRLPITLVYQEMDDLPNGFTVPEGREKPWGTGQAVLAARHAVETPFAVVNADDYYGASAYQVVADFLRSNETSNGIPVYTNVGFYLRDTMTEAGAVNRAVLKTDDEGHLLHIREVTGIEKVGDAGRYRTPDGEEHILPGGTIVSMNMWGFTPDVFAKLEGGFRDFLEERGSDPKAEFFLPTRIQVLMDRDLARVKVLIGEGPWCGITYPEDRERVIRILRGFTDQGLYPEPL